MSVRDGAAPMTREGGAPTDGPSSAMADFWAPLRGTTRARIGLPRAGDALATDAVLDLRAAHAAARDAVLEPLDVGALAKQVTALGRGAPRIVASRARDRDEYVRRPDLGREPGDVAQLGSATSPRGYDVALVIADGLSPRAVQRHAAALLEAILDRLPHALRVAPPVIATQARVALGDHLGLALHARSVLVLIGERPGLSVAESVGIYLSHDPRPGKPDSGRNCISNVHPPDGLSYEAAARTAVSLLEGARRLGTSGVALKDIAPIESLPVESLPVDSH